MREIARSSHNLAEAVISTLMGAVVARLTNHHAIIQIVRAAKLRVFDVMRPRDFTKFVLGWARVSYARKLVTA
jgi:hypothetical protein